MSVFNIEIEAIAIERIRTGDLVTIITIADGSKQARPTLPGEDYPDFNYRGSRPIEPGTEFVASFDAVTRMVTIRGVP